MTVILKNLHILIFREIMSEIESTIEKTQPESVEGGAQPEHIKDELLPETVKSNISLGWYQAKFDTSKGASSAYDVIQKVYYREQDGGNRVGNWFRCSRCNNVWQHDSSMGSAPNVRHKERYCPKLTAEQRQKYVDENLARKALNIGKKSKAKSDSNVAAAKSNEQISTSQQAVAASSTSSAPEAPHALNESVCKYTHTEDELFGLVVKASQIGCLYGPVSMSALEQDSLKPDKL